jgi:hypothetical protein
MKQPTFSIPYSVVDKLPPRERFVYYELCRLAATQDMVNEEFRIRIPKGALVTSYLRFSKILDMAYSATAVAMESLAEKNLIELTPLDTGSEHSVFFVVQVKEVYVPYKRVKEQLLRPQPSQS